MAVFCRRRDVRCVCVSDGVCDVRFGRCLRSVGVDVNGLRPVFVRMTTVLCVY